MYRLIFTTALLCLFLTGINGQNKTYEFKNGNWYNGLDFTPGVWYVAGGVMTKKAPAKIDSVIDLENRWVIPPMGDAYCASLTENPSMEQQLNMYASDGIFYLQIPENSREGRMALDNLLTKSGSPDVQYGNGAVTCSFGTPFLKYEAPAMGIKNPQEWRRQYDQIKTSNKMLGNAYWFIDNKDALQANWEKIKAQKPQLLTIYLLDAANSGGKENKGLSDDMAKAVIKKAHKADLRVYARVETVEDLRLALKLGVDGIANLPGHNWDGTGDVQRFELNDDDIKKLAKKKIPVITLFSHALAFGAKANVQEFHKKTLTRLFAQNVQVVIGSDDPIRTTRGEFSYWFNFNVLNSATILKTLCETTPRAIFPDRKIGKFADGYEANFLVLDANPLENILKVRVFSQRYKKGQLLPKVEGPKKG